MHPTVCSQCGQADPLSDHPVDMRYRHSSFCHLRCANAIAWVDLHRERHESIDAQSMRNIRNALITASEPSDDQTFAAIEVTEWLIEKGLTP